MTLTAYLRVYQALDSFPEAEQHRWTAAPEGSYEKERVTGRRWLLSSSLPTPTPEGAFVKNHDGKTYVCPWHTRLRMLTGLIAFRTGLPDEIADAFISAAEAGRAERELSEMELNNPDARSHILHSNWHVPLRWFSAFEDSERILTEDRDGLRIRYETTLEKATERLERTLRILQESWMDDEVVVALQELLQWLSEFDSDGLLELDYASVAATFPDDELVEDRSAAEVWACLEAMESGDLVRAGRTFGRLTERWTEVRAREAVN